MSLVGPRPVVREEFEIYGISAIHYMMGRPGITGPWQISGRSETTFKERVEIDRAYIAQRSFWKDMRVILKTVPSVLLRRGAV